MDVFLRGSTKPLKLQSRIAYLGPQLPAVSEGLSVICRPPSPNFFSLMSACRDNSFCLMFSFFFTGAPSSVEQGSAEQAGKNHEGVGCLQLIATNSFWNVCFLLHYGFASLGHFSIIRMLMENSTCPLLVTLVYLEAIHVFPSSGFNNKRFKLSYTVLLTEIFCAVFLYFNLDFPLLLFAHSFW